MERLRSKSWLLWKLIVVIPLLLPVIALVPQGPPFLLPTSQAAMVRQASSAIRTALEEDGIFLQTIRLPLSEAMYAESEEGFVADRAIGWQGGPQETYRFLAPLTKSLLQTVDNSGEGSGLLPRIQEQILLDFDGSALMTSESPAGPTRDSQALMQPNTDDYYPRLIKQLEQQLTVQSEGTTINRLFLLVNPAWRGANSFGFFSSKQAKEDILDRYKTTYAIDQFVVRGLKCTVAKMWPHNWCVFASNLPYVRGDDGKGPLFLGSFSTRPAYEVLDSLMKVALEKKPDE